MFQKKGLYLAVILAAVIPCILFLDSLGIAQRQYPKAKEIAYTFYIYIPKNIPKNDEFKKQQQKKIINKELEEIFLEVYASQTYGKTDENLGAGEGFYDRGAERAVEEEFLPGPGTAAHAPETGRQGNSKELLSRSNVIKALSNLAWQDKLWLLKILSRCSMGELLQIKSMLQDGVTWGENRAMFMILREKVTDEEQKRIDAIIEAYAR